MGQAKEKKKKKRTNNITCQPGPTKQSFQTSGKKNNNISDLDDNKHKCANKKCLSVFIPDHDLTISRKCLSVWVSVTKILWQV